MTGTSERAGRNILLLIGGALPLWILAEWLQALAVPPPGADSTGWGKPGDAIQMFVLQYLAMAVPVVIGGIFHQAVLLGIPETWSKWAVRTAILLTSPLAGVVLVVMTARPELFFSARIAVPTALALTLYGLLAQPLRGSGTERVVKESSAR